MRPLLHQVTVLPLLLVCVLSKPALSQDWLGQAIAAEDRIHNFGTVARAAKTEHRFEIRNTFQTDMRIASVRASCGCTTPIIETKIIPPGKTGTILAVFNTGKFTGQKKATLTVTLDQPRFTELQLNVSGYIRSDVVVFPGEAQFGQVTEGEPESLELSLDYAGRSDWQIESIESPVDYISAKFEEVSRENGRIKYKINVDLSDNAPTGFVQNQLILHTNDRRLTTVPVALYADIHSAIQVSPKKVSLGSIVPGESSSQRIVIKAKEPFKILNLDSAKVSVDYAGSDVAKKAHLLNLNITPKSGINGEVKTAILIQTDAAPEPIRIEVDFSTVQQSLTSRTNQE